MVLCAFCFYFNFWGSSSSCFLLRRFCSSLNPSFPSLLFFLFIFVAKASYRYTDDKEASSGDVSSEISLRDRCYQLNDNVERFIEQYDNRIDERLFTAIRLAVDAHEINNFRIGRLRGTTIGAQNMLWLYCAVVDAVRLIRCAIILRRTVCMSAAS